MTSDDVLENLVEECHDDHVGLWRIVNAVRLDLGFKEATEVRTATIQLVHRLLDERQMVIGHPEPDGRHFVAWECDTDCALKRIEKEWRELGREPNIGEVAWFTSKAGPSVVALLAEPALAKDWLRPEEDAAWSHLKPQS